MVEYYPITSRDQSRLYHFRKIFLGYTSLAEGIWKGDILVADVEELENLDVRNPWWKTQCKGHNYAEKVVKTIFPIADGTVKLSGRDHGEIIEAENPL